MGPGAPSADTPCGNTGGTARYAAEVSRDNSGAGRARKPPLARGKPSLPGLSVSRSCSQPEHLLYTISPPARAAGAASAPRPMREQRPTPTSPRRNGKRPTHATSCGGAAGKNRAGQRPGRPTSHKRARPARPPAGGPQGRGPANDYRAEAQARGRAARGRGPQPRSGGEPARTTEQQGRPQLRRAEERRSAGPLRARARSSGATMQAKRPTRKRRNQPLTLALGGPLGRR